MKPKHIILKHTETVKGIDLKNHELAERVGDLYYDALAEFLHELSDKLHRDGLADHKRGRVKLANELEASAVHLAQASKHIGVAWDICEPYVQQWKAAHGKV